MSFKIFILLNLILGGAISANTQPTKNHCGQPRITMGSLLDGVRVDAGGRLSFGRLYAICLSEPARKGKTDFAYHPYDGGKLSALLMPVPKNPLVAPKPQGEFVFYAEKFTTLWELPRYEIVGGAEKVRPLEPGNYRLSFYAENSYFMQFPFRVSVIESKDVYRPQKFYLLDGAWNSYAEIVYPNLNRYIQLRVWLRETSNAGLKSEAVQYTVELLRETDEKVLAKGGGETSAMRLTHDWQAFTLTLRPPDGTGEFPAAELLKNEGRYRVNLSVAGKPYGVYFFDVRGGKFQFVSNNVGRPMDFAFPLETGDKGFALWRNEP